MILQSLHLENFRNYHQEGLVFHPSVNLFIGKNGQGKTNLLEAIYYLSTGRSHRGQKDAELLQHGRDGFILKGEISWQDRNIHLEFSFGARDGKTFKLNGIPYRKRSDVLYVLKTVLFSPEDLYLIKGGPRERRRYLDLTMVQLQPAYHDHIMAFHRILQQRNNLLKEYRRRKISLDELRVWDGQLAQRGSQILHRRLEIVRELAPIIRQHYRTITQNQENLDVRYYSSVPIEPGMSVNQIQQVFFQQLEGLLQEEVVRGATLIGPHRDDLILQLNHRDIRTYGSQGQQRTAALTLKLAELQLIRDKLGENPVLLLDDVMSELDYDRREHLLRTIQNHGIQVFITATHLGSFKEEIQRESRIFLINEGKPAILEREPT